MIENEKQYLVTQDRERQFAQLVKRMENGDDDRTPGEHPIIRQAKLDSTRSILQELREEIQAWESGTRTMADTRQPA